MSRLLSSPNSSLPGAAALKAVRYASSRANIRNGFLWRSLKNMRYLLTASILYGVEVGLVSPALAADIVPIKLEANDGSMSISGNLIGIDNNYYHVETSIFGTLHIKVARFKCSGHVCPEIQSGPVPKAIDVVAASDAPKPILADTESKTKRLLGLIAIAEATHRGYDTVQLGAKVRPPAPPTSMTFGDIKKWVKATPGQPHAIGRYQFIPPTFNALQRRLRLSDNTRFSPDIQDKMAMLLLEDAGYGDFLSGQVNSDKFMDSLAAIWAGLPLKSGRSKYHGYAGNKASITRAFFANNVNAIFYEPNARGRRG